jgi:prepilin-type processing-associated H-X9-DG protein
MRNVAFWLRHHIADTVAVLFLVFTLTFILGPVVHAALVDRNQRCIANAFTVSTALLTYASDYDGRLPRAVAFNNAAQLQTDLSPYTRDTTVFRCPATGNAFYALNQTLGAIVVDSLPQVSVSEAFRDPSAHPDGKFTVAYLDGHVERGGVEQPYPSGPVTAGLCVTRERGILAALNRYADDHGGTYPTEQDDNVLRNVLTPYTNNSRLFECPDSSQSYILGTEFRGLTLSSILDRSPILVVDDPVFHRDDETHRSIYLDGYVERNGPNGIDFPNIISTSMTRLRRILTTGLNAYIQDHQGNLPTYSNYEEFEAQLMPYVRASRNFDPPRGPLAFQVNLTLSGKKLSDYSNPATVTVIQDLNDYGDGLITVGRLNGSIVRIRP